MTSGKQLWKVLWNDEAGTVLSAELVLVGTLGVIGATAGVAAVGHSVNGELEEVAYSLRSLDQSYHLEGHRGCRAWTAGSSYTQRSVEESHDELQQVIERHRRGEADERHEGNRRDEGDRGEERVEQRRDRDQDQDERDERRRERDAEDDAERWDGDDRRREADAEERDERRRDRNDDDDERSARDDDDGRERDDADDRRDSNRDDDDDRPRSRERDDDDR